MEKTMEYKEVDITVKGEIDLPSFDIEKYIGNKATIINVKTLSGKHGYFIRVETEIIDQIGDIEIKASRNFGLQTTEKDGETIIGWGKDTKLGLFLKKMGVKHFEELIGKEVILQSQTNSDGKDFLTFN